MKYFGILLCLVMIFSFVESQTSINRIDSIGLKQGVWREFRAQPAAITTSLVEIKNPLDSSKFLMVNEVDKSYGFVIKESYGKYIDNLRHGVWLQYNRAGDLMSRIVYEEGTPKGPCELYWINGGIKMKCFIGDSTNVEVFSFTENGELFDVRIVPKNKLIKLLYEE